MRTYDRARGVVTMSPDEWRRTHKDFKSTEMVSGKRVRTVLQFVDGLGTCRVCVEIVKESK